MLTISCFIYRINFNAKTVEIIDSVPSVLLQYCSIRVRSRTPRGPGSCIQWAITSLTLTRIVLHIACSTGISQPFLSRHYTLLHYTLLILHYLIILVLQVGFIIHISARALGHSRGAAYARARSRDYFKWCEKTLMKEQPHY